MTSGTACPSSASGAARSDARRVDLCGVAPYAIILDIMPHGAAVLLDAAPIRLAIPSAVRLADPVCSRRNDS
jgi:hypothetical protein